MSGVLSSWLASAVKRCRLAKLCSSRASMPLTVSASRAISSPDIGTASRRWRLVPSEIASTSSMMPCTGRSEVPASQ